MDNDNLAGLAIQLAALANLVAQQAKEIGELKEWRASVDSQMVDEDAQPAVDLDGKPIRAR